MSKEKYDNDELIKALSEFFDAEEIDKIFKSDDAENKEEAKEEKEEVEDEESDDVKKAKSEYEEMEKALQMKKEEISKMCGVKKSEKEDISKSEKEEKEEAIEKAEKEDKSEILKSFVSNLENRFSSTEKSQEDILKSLNVLTENYSKVAETIEKISNQPQGMKTYQNLNFIEKAESVQDEDGKTVLSLTRDKDKIEKAIEDLIEGGNMSKEKVNQYQRELIGYNAGGAPISKSLIGDLYKNSDIKLAQ